MISAALVPQRRHEVEHHGLDLVVDAKGLQHRKADRQQRHQREQCGVNEAHCPQVQLAVRQIAADQIEQSDPSHQPGLPPVQAGEIRIPDRSRKPLPEFMLVWVLHKGTKELKGRYYTPLGPYLYPYLYLLLAQRRGDAEKTKMNYLLRMLFAMPWRQKTAVCMS